MSKFIRCTVKNNTMTDTLLMWWDIWAISAFCLRAVTWMVAAKMVFIL